MKTNLHMLQTYVAQIIEPPPAKYLPEDMLVDVQVECDHLKVFLFDVFNGIHDAIKIKEVFNWYHTHLIIIADTLWKAISKTNETAEKAMRKIINLLTYMEAEYYSILNNKLTLPLFEVQRLNSVIIKKLDPLNEMLSSKNINDSLNRQVGKALQDYFRQGRYPALSYANKQYLEIFLPQLQSLAEDQRDKNWDRRLRQLLIKYNFNNMGIYKLLESENEKEFKGLRNPEDWLNLHYNKSLWIEQIMEVQNLAYSPSHKSLKELLLKHLRAKGKHQKDRLKVGQLIKPNKFHRNINVSELALDLHYRFYESEFGYRTKKEAAIAFCNSNSSKETANISPHSISKFDKLEQRDAALKLYQRYQRMVSKLAKDFDLRLW